MEGKEHLINMFKEMAESFIENNIKPKNDSRMDMNSPHFGHDTSAEYTELKFKYERAVKEKAELYIGFKKRNEEYNNIIKELNIIKSENQQEKHKAYERGYKQGICTAVCFTSVIITVISLGIVLLY